MHRALYRSPPILAQELFSADFVNVFVVALVARQFAAGEGEGAQDDG